MSEMTLMRASCPPTDRSNVPLMSAKVMPAAAMPTYALSRRMELRLETLTKAGSRMAATPMSRSSRSVMPQASHSWPSDRRRSPLTRRCLG